MSDRIYTNDDSFASEDFVIVAEACHGSLTKTNFANGNQKSYDFVKLYNFDEVRLTCLQDLYALSIGMITEHKKCFIRARIKDETNSKRVVRKCNGPEATLVLEKFHWVPIDIDWEHPSSGNVKDDLATVLSALPETFRSAECFTVASSSYGFKPGIKLRLFFWNNQPVSGIDIKNALEGYKLADPALYNPIQLIYTSEPIGVNPVKQRVYWKTPFIAKPLNIQITDHQHASGTPEVWYTKNRAELNKVRHFERISWLSPGERHDGLRDQCLPLGKLVGQEHYDRETMIYEVMELLDNTWTGKRDVKKDRDTIIWAIDKGIASMDQGI